MIGAEPPPVEPGEQTAAEEPALQQIPHLLDFHDLRRPECIAFWVLMILCFAYGFVPKKREHHLPSSKA